jgi:hypothetical protein
METHKFVVFLNESQNKADDANEIAEQGSYITVQAQGGLGGRFGV